MEFFKIRRLFLHSRVFLCFKRSLFLNATRCPCTSTCSSCCMIDPLQLLLFAQRGKFDYLCFSRSVTNHRAADLRKPVGNCGGSEFISMDRIRNIGIMAHIDAGKTTTTERMLFYSGFTRYMGDVDDGDTVTDYMEQERNRGITITSAAVTFFWDRNKINLIDTPGHVDFTLEVERSLRVLDGSVAVLDASAGVEAQTLTVWRQADNYHVPRIIYLNKMDKAGADFRTSVSSVEEKLKVVPFLIQLPVGCEKNFTGIVDVVTMEKVSWDKDDRSGQNYTKCPLDKSKDLELYEEACEARTKLIEQLADLDDTIGDYILSDTDFRDIPVADIYSALRRVTLSHGGVPILCGSSYKNRGVQPLMDAIIRYLPSPLDRKHDFIEHYGNDLCAMAFKIVHDKHRGALTFLRLYSGELESGSTLYNINRECTEKTSRLLQVSADEHKDLSCASAGNIVAVSGLKQTITGDTLVASHQSARKAKKVYQKHHSVSDDENGDPVLAGVMVPSPVFFCSVEPPSLSHQKALDHALLCLTREDPSLRVHTDNDTGQTILSGMGELHLEIIQDRIRKEHGVDVDMGPLQIAYREALTESVEEQVYLDKTLGDTKHRVSVSLSLHPVKEQENLNVKVMPSKDSILNSRPIRRQHYHAVNAGATSGLSRGPLLGFPVVDVEVQLHDLRVGYGTSLAMVTAATAQCVLEAIKKANPVLMEPLMKLEIHTDDSRQSTVLSDLSQRRSQILDIQARQDIRVIQTLVPLAEMMGYSTALRTITSGTATFTMEVSHYESLNELERRKAFQRVTGFM